MDARKCYIPSSKTDIERDMDYGANHFKRLKYSRELAIRYMERYNERVKESYDKEVRFEILQEGDAVRV
jgi:hypothetical protein